MNKTEFYSVCDDILNEYPERKPPVRKTRWGPREPGSGRYSIGLLRYFSSDCVQVAIPSKNIGKTLSAVETIALLRKLFTEN